MKANQTGGKRKHYITDIFTSEGVFPREREKMEPVTLSLRLRKASGIRSLRHVK